MGIFSDAQGQLTPVFCRIWLKFKLVRDIIDVLVTCKYEEDPIKKANLHIHEYSLIRDLGRMNCAFNISQIAVSIN